MAADAWLGRREIFANHCEGLHYPFLPADEFFDRDDFRWLDQLEFGNGTIIAELRPFSLTVIPGLTPYISLPSGVPDSKWSVLDKSLDWGLSTCGKRVSVSTKPAPVRRALPSWSNRFRSAG